MSFIVAPPLPEVVQEIVDSIRHQMASRCYRAANELRNAAIDVLSGQGGGRRYKIPHVGGYYTASAPGQPPAARTGIFRGGWQPAVDLAGDVFLSKIENNVSTSDYPGASGRSYTLGELLENGTSRMAPRLHHDKIKEQAEPKIVRIYEEPYF